MRDSLLYFVIIVCKNYYSVILIFIRSPEFSHFLSKCLVKDPQSRPSAAELFRVSIIIASDILYEET